VLAGCLPPFELGGVMAWRLIVETLFGGDWRPTNGPCAAGLTAWRPTEGGMAAGWRFPERI